MLGYVANDGQRRKPAIGRFGEITVEQARRIAQNWLADVRKGQDPCVERSAARQAPTVKELFERFMTEYSEGRNAPSTVKSNRGYGKRHIIPILGNLKVPAVTRDVVSGTLVLVPFVHGPDMESVGSKGGISSDTPSSRIGEGNTCAH